MPSGPPPPPSVFASNSATVTQSSPLNIAPTPTASPMPAPDATKRESLSVTETSSDSTDDATTERRHLLCAAATWYTETHDLTLVKVHYPTDMGTCSCTDPTCTVGAGSPAKHPAVRSGYHVNPDLQIRNGRDAEETWERFPWNIAVLVGPAQGLFVFDFDSRNGGVESLDRMKRDLHGILDFNATYHYNTSFGGSHYYFKADPDDRTLWDKITGKHGLKQIFNKVNYPGLDFKADKGYVVAAPSKHISGEFYTRPNDSPSQITTVTFDIVNAIMTWASSTTTILDSAMSFSSSASSGFASLAAADTALYENLLDQLRKKEPSDGAAARAVTYYKCYGGFPGEIKLIDGEGRNSIWFALAERFISDYMARDIHGFQALLEANSYGFDTDRGTGDIPPALLHATKMFDAAVFDPPYHQSLEHKFIRGLRTAITKVINDYDNRN